MSRRGTEESTSRLRQNAAESTTPVDRRLAASLATKRGSSLQGSTRRQGSANRKSSPAGSGSADPRPAYIPATKSIIKRLAPLTPPRDMGRTPSPPTTPRSPAYKPNLQELGLKDPGPNARLFERISIQDQAYTRKSFVSRADTTAVWQRIPRFARDDELEIHPESLQTKLSDNFIPPARRLARKFQTSRAQKAWKTSRNRRRGKVAAKQPRQAPIDIVDSSDNNTHDDLYASDSGQSVQHQAQPERVGGPSDEIILTLQNLSGLTIQPSKTGTLGASSRLPFLRRKVRKSFLKRCEAEGIPTKGGKRREPEITYVYQTIGSENTFQAASKHWGCPLCDTYSKLETQEALVRHLGDDSGGHPEVKVVMRRENDYRWDITLTMPDVTEEEEEEVDSSESEVVEIFPDSAARRQWKTLAPRREVGAVPMDLDVDVPPVKEQPEELVLPPAEPEIYDDFLDPCIRPPYLPFGAVKFSCRPNGPKLYDILGAKPLDQFGILAWSVIDREEELFEIDGVRDEDKVMQALWCRWIMVNRQRHFIRNYSEGTKQFIRDNYDYIKWGAGWLALRAWLLVLHQTRFLKISEVVEALEFYESLVNAPD